MVSMIPFGLLAGFVEGREVRITEIDESGFCFRTIEENISDSEALKVCFYDIKNGCYRELEIPEYDIQRFDMVDAELSGFYVKYKVTVKQKAYAEAVQRLLYQYNHYIHLKLEEDDSALAKSLTGYPGELDEVKRGSLEEQVGIWRRELTPDGLESAYNGKRIDLTDNCSQYGTGFEPGYKCQVPPESGVAELALEIDRPELYQEYLNSSLTEFSKKYAGKCIGICGSIILEHRVPDHLYIGNQFCHNLFPTEEQLFSVMDKTYSEGSEITLVFSYIREFMLLSVGKLLEKVDNWCCIHGVNVEIVVNDWAMVEMLCGKTSRLHPVLGTLLNKRKKDPRMKYKSGDTLLFQQNSLNAGFYRDFLAEEFHIHRYEWESCGYPQELPPGKNSLHLPFYQTNTSQYCPLYALCTTGDRGTQQLAEHCPKFCEKYALLYPEHLHMAGRYNSLFGVDKTLPESTEMWKNIKGTKPDRIVVNI